MGAVLICEGEGYAYGCEQPGDHALWLQAPACRRETSECDATG